MTNDNVLNVQEFVVAMHLILGVKEGLPLPRSLPKHLHPRAHIPPDIADIAARDREVYQHVFNRLAQDNIDGRITYMAASGKTGHMEEQKEQALIKRRAFCAASD